MSTLDRALANATRQLAEASDTPRLDAELLLCAALGIGRDKLLLDPPTGPMPALFAEMVERRAAGEPVAYISGRRDFWNIELEVGPGVLIPRPDSETLIAAAVEHFAGGVGPKRILDLGTGPGTLLLAALDEWPNATGLGVDFSPNALEYARRNAVRLGLADRAELRLGDWAMGIDQPFDLVLANPPYVARDAVLGPGVAEHEPHEALFAGDDGLDAYRTLAPQLARLIAPGGLAAIEIGFDQGDSAADVLLKAGLSSRLVRDFGGHPRALLVTTA
ncbi:MAG: peptide chain release factor N(5)-glutamine methyltransferase [Sphingomicrobium sp.]